MNKKLRQRVLTKLAQAQPAQPNTATPATVSSPPAVPGNLFAYLASGYNANTIPPLIAVTNQLNDAMHYASNGKDNFQKIIDNNLDLSGASPDQKNVGGLAKMLYDTFFNRKNPFPTKVTAEAIHGWADTFMASPQFNNLTQINPTGALAIKLQGNLKTNLQNLMNNIKQQNPRTA